MLKTPHFHMPQDTCPACCLENALNIKNEAIRKLASVHSSSFTEMRVVLCYWSQPFLTHETFRSVSFDEQSQQNNEKV